MTPPPKCTKAKILRLLSAPLKLVVTQQLQSLLSKYIKDIDIEGLGLFGDVVSHNLELRRDVLALVGA